MSYSMRNYAKGEWQRLHRVKEQGIAPAGSGSGRCKIFLSQQVLADTCRDLWRVTRMSSVTPFKTTKANRQRKVICFPPVWQLHQHGLMKWAFLRAPITKVF